MQVAKWGNSLAVRIPVEIARELGIKEGDDVELVALDASQVAVVTERQQRKAAVDRLRQAMGTLPPGYRFNREELYGRDADRA